jgi:hypothetical protein
LWRSSCRNPKGHAQPQITRPSRSPNSSIVPSTYAGNFGTAPEKKL